MKQLRQKMVSGFAWSSVNVVSKQVLSLGVHIFLARLLLPEDFGIIGMISIFTDLSLRLQGAGLGESLIRQSSVTQEEYNFVFYYGLVIGLICYALLFAASQMISDFFNEPRLVWVIRVLTLNLVLIPIRRISWIQLVKQLDFNRIARIEILSSVISGGVAIVLAYKGFGVWSLVSQALCLPLVSTVLFLAFNWWMPTLSINRTASKKLFSFGSQLMLINFIETGFKNIYNVVIGRQYTAAALGFYTQGTKLQRLPSNAINAIIKSVSFPAFASIREDRAQYKAVFGKTMRLLTYINFPILAALAAIADPLIPFLLSDKWVPAIPFFQLLIVVGLLEPVKSLFINILKVEGKAGRLFRYVVLTKLFYVAGILVTFKISIHALVLSQAIAAVCELMVFSGLGKIIGYQRRRFFRDILPNLALALTIAAMLLAANTLLPIKGLLLLVIDGILGAAVFILGSYLSNNPSFLELRQEITKSTKGAQH